MNFIFCKLKKPLMGEGKRQRQGHVFCLEDLKVGMQVTRTIWSLGSYKR